MAKLNWGIMDQRFYEAGADRGVLYPVTGPGVPWTGLVSVDERSSGGGQQSYYVDGLKYANLIEATEFEATLTALSAPSEFASCDGTMSLGYGLFATEQPRTSFGLSYRTLIGDAGLGLDRGYKIHLVYNALAAPTGRTNATLSDSPEVVNLAWEISTRPDRADGIRPTAHLVVDSTKADPLLLTLLEAMLYGHDGISPRLPSAADLIQLASSWRPFSRAIKPNFVGAYPQAYTTITNLATNPSFEATYDTVEVWRNLATNPSFESTTNAPFEVYRNHSLNPRVEPTGPEYDQALWAGSGGGTSTSVVAASWSPSGRARRREWTTASTSNVSTQITSVKNTTRGITAGTWTFVQWVRVQPGMAFALPGTADFAPVGERIASGDIALGGDIFKRWVTVTIASYDALPSGARIDFWIAGSRAVGDWVEIGATDIYPGAYQPGRPYFDGTYSPDSTMTPSWLGAANASPSVLRATRIEVQRNYFPDTNCTAFNSAWGGYAGNTGAAWVTSRVAASWAISGYAIQAEWTAVPDSSGDLGPVISAAPADEVWTVAFDVVVNRTGAVLSGVGFGGSQVSTSTIVARSHSSALTMTAGVPVRRWMTFIRAATASTNGFRSATVIGNKVVGDKVQIANVDLYPGAYNPVRIAATGTVSTDSDLTPAWTGAANASPSVLTGTAVAGVGATQSERAVCFSSTKWSAHGARSVQVSPRSNDPAVTYAETSVGGLTVGQTYTLLGRVRLASPQTGTLSAMARRFWVIQGGDPAVTYLTTAPNAAGEHEVRGTFVATATNHGIRLMNGAAVGGGDVWWDDFAIVEGVYKGPYFDGGISPDSDLVPSWAGTANASASVLTGIGVPNAGPTNVKRISSSKWSASGSKSVRIIPTGLSNDTTVTVAGSFSSLSGSGVTFTAGKTYTILATLHQEVALSGALNTASRTIVLHYNTIPGWTGAPGLRSQGTPNAPGTYQHRVTFSLPSDAVWCGVRLFNGASGGNGDVWWDDLAIIEGEYTGPYFDGRSRNLLYRNQLATGSWDGTPDASSSKLRFSASLPETANDGDVVILLDDVTLNANSVYVYSEDRWRWHHYLMFDI